MNAEEKMLKYVRFSILQILFVILFGFGLSVVFIKMALQEMLTGSSVFTFLLFFFMVVGFGIFAFIPFLSYGAMIKFLNAHDIYNEAILDFSTARPFLDDHKEMRC